MKELSLNSLYAGWNSNRVGLSLKYRLNNSVTVPGNTHGSNISTLGGVSINDCNVKGKAVPLHAMEAMEERRYSSYSLTTSALDGGEWSATRPGRAFTPGERTPGTHCTGGWVGPRAGLDTEATGKILCPSRESNPDGPVVQPVVRHYTAWANPVPMTIM
jgi:hypothetical protein